MRSLAVRENTQRLIFKVEGMCCATEVEHLKGVLNPLIDANKTTLSFDLINAKLSLESNDAHFPNKDAIIKAVARTGMSATLWSDHVKQTHVQKTFWQQYGHIMMHMASLVSLVIGFILHAVRNGASTAFGGVKGGEEAERPDYPPIATMAFYSTAIVAGGWFIIPKAARAVRRIRPDTNLLMVTATAGAVGINHWFEATSSMYLFSAAELLEAWNMTRARKAIHALMELAPSTAQVVSENGVITEQLVEQISIGATITVRPGEKIPMDSMLLVGSTSVNQAPITGESMPVQKEVGDLLFAGTINGDSVIQCRVTKAASDSTLASIIRKVEEAQSRRAKSDQFIEKFARYYVPSMMAASAVVSIVPPLATGGSWYPWVYKGLELLVISCPCSLVISTPVSIVAGLTAAARSGVLIKGGIYLETAAHIKAFAMDKTGTLTTGEPTVQTIIPLNGYNTKTLLKLAAALEIHSDHPLARAIQRKARAEGMMSQPAERFQIFKGKGAEGYIDGELFWIGSHRFLHEKVGEHEPAAVHEQIQALEAEGHSLVAIGHGQDICGFISIADTLRPESREAIQALKRAGIERVVMLTGDNKGAAKTIADSIGIDEYYAELLPENKVTQLESLVARYRYVAMVGDGINDAPAMAASSLGIAMGAAGSDAAIETADIALMSDDLRKLAWLVSHAHRTLNIIKQNVIFSLVVKSAFVGLTFANKSTLWMAMLSDMGASFIVVSNGLRLLNNGTNHSNRERVIPGEITREIQQEPTVERRPPVLYEFSRTQASSSRPLSAIQPALPAANQTTRVACSTRCCSSNCHASSSLSPVPAVQQEDEKQVEMQTIASTSTKPVSERGVVVPLFTAANQNTRGEDFATNHEEAVAPALVSQFNQLRQNRQQANLMEVPINPELLQQQIEQPKKACCKTCK
ncbi:MAG: heavy metal translocating P-type ATPase [Gammaproteobacteria bacterium]|nr:heavy metal translocating P-type ATPase [Gammaproteobacteria bacterium]